MNATSLRAERALADYLNAADWGEGITRPRSLASYDLGAETYQDDQVQNKRPPFPYVFVRATSSQSIHPLSRTQEITLSLDLYVSADDVNPDGVSAIAGAMDELVLPLFDDAGAAVLDAAADHASGPFTAQHAFPGDLGGSSVEGRARVFNRTITLIGSATT